MLRRRRNYYPSHLTLPTPFMDAVDYGTGSGCDFEVHGVAQLQVWVSSSGSSRVPAPTKREAGTIESKIAWNLTRLLLLLLLLLLLFRSWIFRTFPCSRTLRGGLPRIWTRCSSAIYMINNWTRRMKLPRYFGERGGSFEDSEECVAVKSPRLWTCLSGLNSRSF